MSSAPTSPRKTSDTFYSYTTPNKPAPASPGVYVSPSLTGQTGLNSSFNTLEAQLESKNVQIGKLQSHLANLDSECSTLSQKHESAQAEIKTLKRELQSLEERVAKSDAEQVETLAAKQAVEANLAALSPKYDAATKTLRSLQAELKSKDGIIDEAKADLHGLRRKHGSAQAEIKTLQAQLNSKDDIINQLQAGNADLRAAVANARELARTKGERVRDLQEIVTDFRERNIRLQEALAKSQDEQKCTKAELNSLKAVLMELQASRASVDFVFHAQLQSQNQNLAAVEEQLNDVKGMLKSTLAFTQTAKAKLKDSLYATNKMERDMKCALRKLTSPSASPSVDPARAAPVTESATVTFEPASADLFIRVSNSDGKVVLFQAATAPVDFDQLPDGVYQVTAYVPRSLDTPEEVSQNIYETKVRKESGSVDKRHIDTGASTVKVRVQSSDKWMKHARVVIVSEAGNTLSRTTDEQGRVEITGKERKVRITTPVAVTVHTFGDGPAVESQKPFEKSKPPVQILHQNDCKKEGFAPAVQPAASGSVVVLGDISGSMKGDRLTALKASFKALMTDEKFSPGSLKLFAWNAHVDAAPTNVADQEAWIDGLEASGGNNMLYAIQESLRQVPDAKEVYIMCDGDIVPFVVSGGGTDIPTEVKAATENIEAQGAWSWKAFVALHPEVTFNFIALGKSANKKLADMADLAKGSFTKSI